MNGSNHHNNGVFKISNTVTECIFFSFHSSGMRYVPTGIKLAPEAPLHILPLSLIFVSLLLVGNFLKAPSDIQDKAATLSNNH